MDDREVAPQSLAHEWNGGLADEHRLGRASTALCRCRRQVLRQKKAREGCYGLGGEAVTISPIRQVPPGELQALHVLQLANRFPPYQRRSGSAANAEFEMGLPLTTSAPEPSMGPA